MKFFIILYFLSCLFSVEFSVNPYLQHATPTSINIMWETDSDSQSIVEWGEYAFLTETATGVSINNYGSSRIHTVVLSGLVPDTRYYYRVILGNYDSYSDLYDFITPPDPSSEASFRIIAMSDMQRDGSKK